MILVFLSARSSSTRSIAASKSTTADIGIRLFSYSVIHDLSVILVIWLFSYIEGLYAIIYIDIQIIDIS